MAELQRKTGGNSWRHEAHCEKEQERSTQRSAWEAERGERDTGDNLWYAEFVQEAEDKDTHIADNICVVYWWKSIRDSSSLLLITHILYNNSSYELPFISFSKQVSLRDCLCWPAHQHQQSWRQRFLQLLGFCCDRVSRFPHRWLYKKAYNQIPRLRFSLFHFICSI